MKNESRHPIRHLYPCWKIVLTAAFSLLHGAAADSSYAVDLNYSQGGIVVDGVAYFTGAGTNIGAFDANTLQLLRTYEVGGHTYDSSPMVYQTKNDDWLVIAHDTDNNRTRALYRDTGAVAWTSTANQPGIYFFGYSYYQQPDNSRLIMTANTNGLHAMSGETGQDAWYVPASATGGVTPAVDQDNGWVFYQSNGQVHKINATNGTVLNSVNVSSPTTVTSYNTMLTKDANGSHVATYWYGDNMWDGTIRVYDENLNLEWEKTGLPTAKKGTLTYADGLLVAGSGNQWGATYDQNDPTWKKIVAYNIDDGNVAWETDLSAYTYTAILNVPYYNGYFYAETQDATSMTPGVTSKLFRINASNGNLESILEYGVAHSSCATSIIAGGKLFSGDIPQNRVIVTELATGSSLDWVGPFGDPQLNQMALPDDPGAVNVPMREIGGPVDVTWNGTTGDWGTVGNWYGGEPVADSIVHVDNGGTAVVTATGELCTRLNVGWDPGESGTVQIDSGTLDVSDLTWFGYQGPGAGVQNGGDVTISRLVLADKSSSSGTYHLNDGTLTVTGVNALYSGLIASAGTATFVQTGGTATFGILGSAGTADMKIAGVAGSQGEYRLEGGTVAFYDGLLVGQSGTGTFWQKGADSIMTVGAYGTLGYNASSHGTFQLDDGSVDFALNLSVGRDGLGEYVQNGGTCVVHGDIWSGYTGSSITLNDGDLSVTEIRLNLISPSGLTFDFNGGTLDVEKMHIELTNDGGTLTPGGAGAIGTTLFVNAGYGYTQSSTGTLQLELASTSSNDLLDVTATGMTAGGTLLVELIDGFVPTPGNTFNIIDGTITGTFDTLDLPYAAAAWDVSNLYSDGTISFTFSGILGDANFDNVVNDIDATILANNWMTMSGATWAMGDFNNDGKVDDSDATILAVNWKISAAQSENVPEPAVSVMLVGFIALVVLGRHNVYGFTVSNNE